MNKYQKIIDYDKNEAHYFCNEYGIAMEVSKDIIIDELQEEIKRQEKSQVILDNQNAELQDRINKAIKKINKMFDDGNEDTVIDDLLELEKILQGEDNELNN